MSVLGKLVYSSMLSTALLSCHGGASDDIEKRLIGDWVEAGAANSWGRTSFTVHPDLSLTYDIGASCGTGWPKYGQLKVEGNNLSFRIEDWAGSDDSYRFTFSGDSLILCGAHSRSAFYHGTLVPVP